MTVVSSRSLYIPLINYLIIPLIIPLVAPLIIPLIVSLIIPGAINDSNHYFNYARSYPQQVCQFLGIVWYTFHVLNRRQPVIPLRRRSGLPEKPLPLRRRSCLPETPGRYGTAVMMAAM